MPKRNCLFLLPAAFLLLFLACCCDSGGQYRVTGNTPAEKIENISSDVEAMNWDGPKLLMKVKITDQISRVKNGMKKGVITDDEAEEIIRLIEMLSAKISEMEHDMNNKREGMGGPPGGGMGKPPNGMGRPPEGMDKRPDGGAKGIGGNLMELVRLKSLIDDLYLNTVTVSAETTAKENYMDLKQ